MPLAAPLAFFLVASAQLGVGAEILAARVDEYLTRLSAFGYAGAAVVAVRDQVILERGFGVANREAGTPVTADTVFTIGSITKQFTAAAIVDLADRGLLAFDDPITAYFDDVPAGKAAITIHHLLTHSSGLPEALGGDFDLAATRQWVVRAAMQAELAWPAGSGYLYSNVGYSLLGAIIEQVSGMGYEAYLRERLFEPAGMNDTGYVLPRFAPARLAQGYRQGEHWGTVLGRDMLQDGPSWNLRANGGIHSTVGDMYRWYRALRSGTVLSDAGRERMFSPLVSEGGSSHYGYGWAIFRTPRGTKLIGHNGGNGVFSADARMYWDERVFIFVTSTSSEFFIDDVSSQLARLVFEGPGGTDMPPPIVALGEEELRRHAGTYTVPSGDTIEVTVVGNGLKLTATGPTAQRLLWGVSEETTAMRTAAERSERITRDWVGGDYTSLHAALGGAMPVEQLAEQSAQIMAMREAAYGPLQGVDVPLVTPGRVMVAWVRMRHAEGEAFMRYGWRGNELVEIQPVRGMPTEEPVLLPKALDRFVAWSLAAGVTLEVVFDDAAGGLLVISTSPAVRARRR